MNHDQGKSNRTVVQSLIRDMNDFSAFVNNQLAEMNDSVDRLGEYWMDKQYQQFQSYIRELTEALKQDLNVFDEASNQLQKKLDMYD